jgi:hypothetical protein
VPETQPHPDPGVLERLCLVLQHPLTDEPDEQMKAFQQKVWGMVQEHYGRFVAGWGEDEQVIEAVSSKHRDTAIALVLDGLRRYGLIDRAKVICTEPDPNDW